jgi:acyl carrier protein
LDDGPLREQTAARLEAVMRPKVVGAWTLHAWSSTRELDHFVMFSSIASLLGSEQQSSYAAANAFLDGLALERHAQGLPATSINWGPWASVGMAASLGDYLERQGLRLLAPNDALERMGHALASGQPRVVIVDADWPRVAASGAAHRKRLLEALVDGNAASFEAQPLRDALATLSLEDGARSCLAYVLNNIRSTLGLEASAALDADCGFRDLGLDSMMLVELRNALLSATGLALPATLLLDVGTPLGLARHLADSLCRREDSTEDAPASTAHTERDALDLLHDQQVQELLDHELAEAMRL